MLNHTPDKRVDLDGFPLDPLALVGPLMRRDPVPIVAIDTPERDGRTHHVLREIPRHTLIPCRPIALVDIGHKPLAIARVTRLDESTDRLALHRLSQHRPQRPVPFFPEPTIQPLVQMPPLCGVWLPSPTGGDERQRGVVRS